MSNFATILEMNFISNQDENLRFLITSFQIERFPQGFFREIDLIIYFRTKIDVHSYYYNTDASNEQEKPRRLNINNAELTASNLMKSCHKVSKVRMPQCENFMIFPSLRFSVKSISGIQEVQKLPFLQFWRL